MKKIITNASLCSIILLNSCTSTLLSSKKQNTIDAVVQKNNTYTFIKTDGTKETFRVTSISDDKVTGQNTAEKTIEIDKNQISEIKKSNTAGTVLIAVGVIGAAIVIPAYVKNKPVGQ